MAITRISVRGARQHNLKNIDVEIPRNTLTVITGLSGSGKSSLAFDTIYAEGQRRYVETLSAYARQFLDQMERPDVDGIDGLSPSISIEQKTTSRSPRSTVGTITEIYDYFPILSASTGKPHSPTCGKESPRQSADQIVSRVLALKPEDRVMILAPIVRGRKGEFKKEMEKLVQQGFTRARVDGEIVSLEDDLQLDKRKNHTVEVVVDRLLVKPGIEGRLENSVAVAMSGAEALFQVALVGGDEQLYSSKLACPDCGMSVAQLEPRSFSFNSLYGACPECHGLGSKYDFDPDKVINGWSKPLLDGGLGPGSASANLLNMIEIAARAHNIDLRLPFDQLTQKAQNIFLYGDSPVDGKPTAKGSKTGFRGIFAYLKRNLEESTSDRYRESLMEHMSATACPVCNGRRLRPESLAVKVHNMSIADFTALPISRSLETAKNITLKGRDEIIAGRVMHEIRERLEFLNAVGLNYLSLDRSAATLSGGEGQRIRLATQIGSKLRGVLYVLDEPSIGLHRRAHRHQTNGKAITILGAHENNLKHLDVTFPLGVMTVVTGVSGSGKSTLVNDILYPVLAKKLYRSRTDAGDHKSLTGSEHVDKIIRIDQSPIGRTPRSNPATYTGVFSQIRDIYAMLPESRERGYKPGRFSFNVAGGRCEACQGEGQRRIEMNFLPDVYVVCEICGGQRYNHETLAVRYKGCSIADLLETPIADALGLLENIPGARQKLQTMVDVGLGYIHLGQSAVTLSGGEAQRIKLARELSKRQTGKTIYLLDEPTTGLHFEDVSKLLDVLHRLTDLGNTVIIIEHNLDIIRNADWLIDLGPEGGEDGGRVVAQGTPEQVAKVKKSYTGQALAQYFKSTA